MARKVVAREKWLEAGLAGFGEAGLSGLKVEAMAWRLGSSKAGFYWYFGSRAAYERELFEYWRERETRRVIAEAEREADPLKRVVRILDEVLGMRDSGDFVFFLRRLGRRRASVARLLRDTEDERVAYVARTLSELGVADPELAAEALYHLYLGWLERNRFKDLTPEERGRQLRVVGRFVGVRLLEES